MINKPRENIEKKHTKMNNALQTYNGELSLITRPMPKLTGPNDVLIKVTHAGVCGTDLSIIAGRFEAAKKIIQGHEFSGVVSEIGTKIKHLKIGDRYDMKPNFFLLLFSRLFVKFV